MGAAQDLEDWRRERREGSRRVAKIEKAMFGAVMRETRGRASPAALARAMETALRELEEE